MNETHEETIRDALSRHVIDLPDGQVQLLDRYCRLLWDINERLNLTRHCDYEKFVSRDLVDSLQLARQLAPGQRILDVGTGGGVPGVVLAITQPQLHVELCESIAKKATAVESIVGQLGLPCVVHHARAEQLLESQCYDVLVARAVGPLWKILRYLRPCWASVGKLLLIKGPNWTKERHDARSRGLLKDLQLRRLATYSMPGASAESVVLGIWPSKS